MTASTLISERLNRSVLSLEVANINGDITQAVEVPLTFGDCFLHDVQVVVTSIATMMTNPALGGIECEILNVASAYVEPFGSANWVIGSATRLHSSINSERGALWRAGESLFVSFQEVDTNASPAADLTILCRVTRMRSS